VLCYRLHVIIISVTLVVTVCCQLCDVNCSGTDCYILHCAGKQHCKVCSLCDLCASVAV